MKLLILAQTPPPLHGQSLMVETAVHGLPGEGVTVHHINLRLSRSGGDIGRWRAGKFLAVLDACCHAVVARFTARCDTLYYVPAPGKRGALYRDWVVLALCRPFFPRLVLHFHNGGLAAWLTTRATAPERALTHLLLGRADLAIVLADALRADAEALAPRRVAIVPNGIEAPATRPPRGPAAERPLRVLFLGACAAEKGLFLAAEAVLAANRRAGRAAFQLTAAGAFADAATAARFTALAAGAPEALRAAGFVRGAELEALWATADCLCLPTTYAHEAQPLVALEALARDVPVIASAWRGLPDALADSGAQLVPPDDVGALTEALLALRAAPPAAGVGRRAYERRFTRAQHLRALAATLRSL
jgi:glycosyltransferase involved in cell wall biosynthesis